MIQVISEYEKREKKGMENQLESKKNGVNITPYAFVETLNTYL